MRAREAKAALARLSLTAEGHERGRAIIDALHKSGDRVSDVRSNSSPRGGVRIESGSAVVVIKGERPDGS